jgi:hypothetical protein
VLSSGSPTASLNQTTGLTLPSDANPDNTFSNPGVGSAAIAALSGGGIAVLTWGSSSGTYAYDLELLSNSGVVTKTSFEVGSSSDGNNMSARMGTWSGGIVIAYYESNTSSTWEMVRYNNSGTLTYSAITLPTSFSTISVDSQGDVMVSTSASDVYTNSGWKLYSATNTVIASGTTAEKEAGNTWAALSGGGFITVSYTPNAAWNTSLGYTGYNLVIQEVTASGTLSTVYTLFSALSTPGGSGSASVSNVVTDSNGDLYFLESGQTEYDKYVISTGTLTREAYTVTGTGSFSIAPSNDGAQGAIGVSVTASNTLELQTLDYGTACYVTGTNLAGGNGPVAVETLRAGTRLRLALGGEAEIVWMGHRHVDCRRHPRPAEIWPVRVAPDAFGPGMPAAPLYLSPDHAVFVDGVLIPVRYLLNGASIAQEPRDEVTYWHVELARHDVLLAEGLPCESYLDTGNRAAFDNAGGPVQLHADFSPRDWALQVWEGDACAPLVLGGARLSRVKAHLLSRLGVLGYAISEDPELVVCTETGEHLLAQVEGNTLCFAPPDGTRRLRLLSRSARPVDVLPGADDPRRLGVALDLVELDGERLDFGDARFLSGWQAPEPGMRWTDGEAWLDLRGASVVVVRWERAGMRYIVPTEPRRAAA